jgi:MFS family permease
VLAASFYVAELFGAPIFGSLSDRMGERLFMSGGPVCGAIAIQFIGWPSLVVALPLLLAPMALGRLIEGLSTATTAPSTLSYLSAETEESAATRGRVMSWYEMATVVGIGLGFVSGGLLWDRLGHAAFVASPVSTGSRCLRFRSCAKSRPRRRRPRPRTNTQRGAWCSGSADCFGLCRDGCA